MDDANGAYNHEQSSAAETVVKHVTAQEDLAVLINRLGATTVSCWWKLIGNDHNCLCWFLDRILVDSLPPPQLVSA